MRLSMRNLKWAREALRLEKVNETYLRVVAEAAVVDLGNRKLALVERSSSCC